MAKLPEDAIMEEREELMVPPTGVGDPTLRTAHFLKPSITSIDGPVFELPPTSPLSSPSGIHHKPNNPNKWPLKVAFHGWRYPNKNWKKWVHQMHSIHQTTWNRAGIREAILSSTYETRRYDNLILGVAEKWCPETNTFVFPWGEATVTLEDMMILGGYSVLGDSVSTSTLPENRELMEINDKLVQSRREVSRTKAQKACQSAWMVKFMDSGSEIEHEAFLALWLSRFVFPSFAFNTIKKSAFPVAALLARGARFAMAPAVLASIYRDLTILKAAIDGQHLRLTLWSPLQLVQIWVWERFPTLRPKPNSIGVGNPRMARWEKVKRVKIDSIAWKLDYAGESFQWRPYAHKLCRETERWVWVDSAAFDEEIESLARCLRASELVGLDCVEQYLPHRVAMQFGMDQDLPGRVERSNATREMAWESYIRPVGDEKLYVPPRLFESDVTTRYLEWWRNKSRKFARKRDADDDVRVVKVEKKGGFDFFKRSTPKCKVADENDDPFPPGFPPKCDRAEKGDPDDDDDDEEEEEEDRLTVAEFVRKTRIRDRTQLRSVSSSTDDDLIIVPKSADVIELSDTDMEDENESGAGKCIQPVTEFPKIKGEEVNDSEEAKKSKPGTYVPPWKTVKNEALTELILGINGTGNSMSTEQIEAVKESSKVFGEDGSGSSRGGGAETRACNSSSGRERIITAEIPGLLELEERISRVERVVAQFKATKLRSRFA